MSDRVGYVGCLEFTFHADSDEQAKEILTQVKNALMNVASNLAHESVQTSLTVLEKVPEDLNKEIEVLIDTK